MDGSQWVNYFKETFTYDSNGNILSDFFEMFVDGQWVNIERMKYTYDTNWKELSYLLEVWDGTQWVNSSLLTSTYDVDENLITQLNQAWDGTQWSDANTTLIFYDSKERAFSFTGYKIEVSYKNITPVKDETSFAGLILNCSPNPSSGPITINYSLTEPATTSLTITNSLGLESAKIGSCQMQMPGEYYTNYDAGNLIPGIYFMTIKSGNKTETKKFEIVK